MKSSNVKKPLEWEHVQISELQVNGVRLPIHIDIKAPKEGLYLMGLDREGKELFRVQVPTKI